MVERERTAVLLGLRRARRVAVAADRLPRLAVELVLAAVRPVRGDRLRVPARLALRDLLERRRDAHAAAAARRAALGQVDAERVRRLRSDDAVDRQPLARLEAPHGVAGLRAEDAVGRNAELLLQLHDERAAAAALEHVGVGAGGRGERAGQREREHERGNEDETAGHGTSVGSFGRLRGELSGSRGKIALRGQSTRGIGAPAAIRPVDRDRPRSEWVPRSPSSGTAETRQYGSVLPADGSRSGMSDAPRLSSAIPMASAAATVQEPDDPEVADVAWDLEPLVDGRRRGGRAGAAGGGGETRGRVRRRVRREGRRAGRRRPARSRWRSSPRCTSSSAAPAPTPRCASPSTPPIRRSARCSSTCRSAARRSRRRCCSSSWSGPRSTTSAPRRCWPIRRLAFCAHHLRSERRYRPYLLSEPEERILNEKAISARSAWARLFAELMSVAGGAAAGPAGAGRRSSRRSRGCPARTATSAARPPRPSPRRCSRASARAPRSTTRCCTTRRSTTACAATRTGSRRATSRTRRATRRSRRS